MPKLNLHPIKSIASILKPSGNKEDKVRAITRQLYHNQQLANKDGGDNNWQKAERIYKSPARRFLFWVNQPLIKVEKRAIEPVAAWVDNADLFRIIERVSPAIEALGVIAIPFVLFFAGQQYQDRLQQQEDERLQQQAVKEYIGQLSTILLDANGNLRDPENERLRTLTTASTLTLLREPNLDGERKGQVIKFLSQMELVNRDFIYGPYRPEDKVPTLSLNGASLNNAELDSADLVMAKLDGANLRNSNLRFSELGGAYMDRAILNDSDLRSASLTYVNLSQSYLANADLGEADLRYASLVGADLSNAKLENADLGHAILIAATLDGADLTRANLSDADLSLVGFGRKITLSMASTDYRQSSSDDRQFYIVAYRRLMDFRGSQTSRLSKKNKKILKDQLEKALLCRTKLPEGVRLDPNRDCDYLEFLKKIRYFRSATVEGF